MFDVALLTRLNMLLPLLEQGVAALYNFLLIFVASLLLPVEQFVTFSYVWLYVLLILNAINALVFQPFMRMIAAHDMRNARAIVRLSVISIIGINFLGGLLAFYLGPYYNETLPLIGWTTVTLFAVAVYELGRRVWMLAGRWHFGVAFGVVLHVSTWTVVWIAKPVTPAGFMAPLVVIYGAVGLVSLALGLMKLLHDAPLEQRDDLVFLEYFRFGAPLLVGAVAFWFFSGGYLFFVGKILPTTDVAALRMIQNLFNGVLLLLVAIENYILSGGVRALLRRLGIVHSLLASFVIVYGLLVYLVFTKVYPGIDAHAELVLIWTFTYLLLAFSRIWMSLLKWYGHAMKVGLSQINGTGVFLLLLFLCVGLGAPMNALLVSLLWFLTAGFMSYTVGAAVRRLRVELFSRM